MSSKDAYYFSHDSNSRQDEKIIALRMKHGWEGYGLFWALIEKLRDVAKYMCVKDYNLIAFDLHSDASKIKSIIEDFGLFSFTTNDGNECFYSESLSRRMSKFDDTKSKFSISGIKGNLIKNKHLTKLQISKMSDDEILEFNDNLKENLGGDTGGGRDATAKKGDYIKVNKIKVNEIRVDENVKFSPASSKKILLSRQISIEQWAMRNKVSVERIQECISEFSDFKCRTLENLKWQNESDLIKNFEFWLNTNAHPKTENFKSKTFNNGPVEIYRNRK